MKSEIVRKELIDNQDLKDGDIVCDDMENIGVVCCSMERMNCLNDEKFVVVIHSNEKSLVGKLMFCNYWVKWYGQIKIEQ